MKVKPILWFTPAFIVFVGILLLSTVLSIPFQIEEIEFTDKLEHIFAYSVLIITLLFAFRKNGLLRASNWVWLIIGCSIYGILLEFIQYSLFPNRFFEWLDASANVIGAVIGSIFFKLVWRVKKESK